MVGRHARLRKLGLGGREEGIETGGSELGEDVYEWNGKLGDEATIGDRS